MRNDKGQFTKGNSGGPGRPPRNSEEAYLIKLNSTVTLDDWQAIVEKAKTQALDGDGKARDWLTKFLIPTPEITQKQLAESESKEEAMDLKKLTDDELRRLEELMIKASPTPVESIRHML